MKTAARVRWLSYCGSLSLPLYGGSALRAPFPVFLCFYVLADDPPFACMTWMHALQPEFAVLLCALRYGRHHSHANHPQRGMACRELWHSPSCEDLQRGWSVYVSASGRVRTSVSSRSWKQTKVLDQSSGMPALQWCCCGRTSQSEILADCLSECVIHLHHITTSSAPPR